jgi:hypothetical protein
VPRTEREKVIASMIFEAEDSRRQTSSNARSAAIGRADVLVGALV